MTITPEMLPQLLRSSLPRIQPTAINFRLPKPYAKWQEMVSNSKIKIAAIANGTKTGKTLSGSTRVLHFSHSAAAEQDALYRIIAPTYQLSKLTYQYINRIVPATLMPQRALSPRDYEKAANTWRGFTPERSESRGWMRWPHNQARIECVHGLTPEVTIEGHRSHGNLYDEAGKLKQQAFSSGQSTTTQTGGWNWAQGTPRGKNWFYELYRMCEEHMKWAERTGKPLEMYCHTARTIDSPFIDKEAVARAKATLPERMFRQLYLAEFLDSGSVFVGYRACVEGPSIDLEDKRVQQWLHPDAAQCDVVLGSDWAKRGDFYVTVAIDPDAHPRPKVMGIVRAQGIQYREALEVLGRFSMKFKGVHLMRHDRTGVGDVIDELLDRLPYPIEPVVFTNSSKAHMVERWMVALESESVSLPNWKPLIDEHDNYDCTTTPMGLPKYGAVDGEHDDIVTACMLAWSAVCEMKERSYTVRFLDDLQASKSSPLESWYSDLSEDED